MGIERRSRLMIAVLAVVSVIFVLTCLFPRAYHTLWIPWMGRQLLNKEASQHERERAAWSLGEFEDPRAMQLLVGALADREVASAAADSLVSIGRPAVPVLSEALQDHRTEVRRSAAEVLGRIGDDSSAESLIASLGDVAPEVRYSTASALGEVNALQALEPLERATDDPDAEVRTAALHAVGRLGEPGRQFLLRTMQSADGEKGDLAAWTLAKLHDPRAVDYLEAVVSGNSEMAARSSAAHYLWEIGEPGTRRFRDALRANNRRYIARAYPFFLEGLSRGDLKGIEPHLVNALNSYGNAGMAKAFLDSKNVTLDTAARKWADKHGYQILKIQWPG
jgi:HEAT repeat protein